MNNWIYIYTLLSEIVHISMDFRSWTSRWEPMVFHAMSKNVPADEIGWVGWVGSMVGFDVDITTALNSNLGCHETTLKRASFHVENRKSPLTILNRQAFVADFPHVSFEEKRSCKFKSHSWISLVLKWTMILTLSGSVGWRWHITVYQLILYSTISYISHCIIYIHLFRSFLFTSYCIDFDMYCIIFWNSSQYMVLYYATSTLHHSCQIILH